MKGVHLGEFEELTLLAVRALDPPVYGIAIQQCVERAARRPVSMGGIHAALVRLEAKGLVTSTLGEPSPTRGGKRKRLFEITALGMRMLRDTRQARERIWRVIEERS